jgi:hypothetical protein
LKNNSEISRTIASYRKFADFRELGLGQGVVNPVNESALDSLSFPRKHVSERYSSATTQNDIQGEQIADRFRLAAAVPGVAGMMSVWHSCCCLSLDGFGSMREDTSSRGS